MAQGAGRTSLNASKEAVESRQSLGQADTVVHGQGSCRGSLRTAATIAGPPTAYADPPGGYLTPALPTEQNSRQTRVCPHHVIITNAYDPHRRAVLPHQ
jgi:hypothetical protein